MVEAYHAAAESTEDDESADEKKDQKKRAAKAHLGKLSSHEHVHSDRPHKLGGEVLRPLAVELPKRSEPEATPKEPEDRSQIPLLPTEIVAGADELKKTHDEVVAAVAKEDDDEEPKGPKKPESVQPVDATEETPEEQVTEPDTDDGRDVPDHVEAAFQEMVASPDMAELAALEFPELAPEKNTEAVIPPLPEVPAAPDLAAEGYEAAESPRGEAITPPAQAGQEQEPAAAPVGESDDAEPPRPPTTERFGWGDSDNNPWEQPAGGLSNPKVLERIDKIDARERLNDAYHSSRETGLAAAVGLVGLGLILEHFAAKRRDKRLKRKIDTQERQLHKTNQAVQLEQRASRLSRRKLERHEATQAARSEHARTIISARQAAEAAAVAAAAEHRKTDLSAVQERVLAERLVKSKELGRAIKQNPELTDIQDVPELKRTLATTQETIAQQEQQVDGLQRAVSYEKLRGKQTDRSGGSSAGGGVDGYGMPTLPTPHQQLPAGVQADLLLDEHALIAKKGKASSNAIVPVAAVTVLLILAAVMVIVFAKL